MTLPRFAIAIVIAVSRPAMRSRPWKADVARRLAAAFLGPLLAASLLSACTTNPATGKPSFTPFMSKAGEVKIGREEHPRILAEFGGEVADPAVRAYVESIGRLLVQTSETPNDPFVFTVLNSDMVNAFALPGGYVYITRGLMALANNEAELAGVIGHEIGHVTARHSAQRYSQGVAAGLGALILGAATNNRGVADLANLGAGAYLQSFSRDQEFEADMLGVRYIARAGFDPNAMSTFLTQLQRHSALESQIIGKSNKSDAFDIFSTHPRTADRVKEAVGLAGNATVRDPMLARDIYLGKIDGLVYGSDPKEGVVRNREFLHPDLKFAFEAPPGYRLVNQPSQVVGFGPGKARLMFDIADKPADGPMTYYLTDIWLSGVKLEGVEAIRINGLDAATARTEADTSDGRMDVRVVAIRKDVGTIFRFVFLTPPEMVAEVSEDLRRTTYSFRLLSDKEAGSIRPLRLRVVTVKAGDTVGTLSAPMPFDEFKEARFRVLNGLEQGQQPMPGQKVKIVVD